jgi:MinD-like ATPase involved in chromosome partitioning or flagellar assembly
MNNNYIIAFANQKGGVGKTTLCVLFANYLVAKGKKVIASTGLGSTTTPISVASVDCNCRRALMPKVSPPR